MEGSSGLPPKGFTGKPDADQPCRKPPPVASAPPESNHNASDDGEETQLPPADEVDSEDDRKPAAIDYSRDSGNEAEDENEETENQPSSEDEERDSGDNNDSSASSSDESEDEDESEPVHVGEDGRPLSQYEILRLKRIQRNRQYLSSLGLEGKDGGGVLGKKPARPKKKAHPKKPAAPSQKRTTLSRRTKQKRVSYAEPSISVASLLKGDDSKDKKPPPKAEEKPKGEVKTKDRSERMEKYIYLEFRSVKSHQNQSLKQAERHVRAAEKEIKYWTKRVEIWERQQQRKREAERAKKELEEELRHLGGTLKELLQDIDRRMPELLDAAEQYDEKYEAASKKQEREMKRLEAEHKMKLLASLDRFPRAMKEAASVLNSALVERAPKDPPPPRRSRRTVDETEESPSTKKRPAKAEEIDTKNKVDTMMRNLQSELVVRDDEDDSPNKDPAVATTKKRMRNVRNVGGWVSPNFASEIDRSWLQKDTSDEQFNLSTYVPQVGDIVLYYPEGHRDFLARFPDFLGKKTRSKTRPPLWERAAMEKEEMKAKESESAESARESTCWWNDDWLSGVEGDLGKYPLMCRVDRTHAEFPPDPFTKVVKRGPGDVHVSWRKPKESATTKQAANPPMRLAVTLRPLSPVLPPTWSVTGPSESEVSLPLPPQFSVVTFPSELQPFLVPFAWAYPIAHSLSMGDKVGVRTGGAKVRISSFATIDGQFGSFRLDDKISLVKTALSQFNNGSDSTRVALEKAFADTPQTFPLPEAFVVLETFAAFVERRAPAQDDVKIPAGSFRLFDLIRSSLPLWNSVSVMRDVYDRKRQQLSPWDLVPGKSTVVAASSNALVDASHALDEALRVKIECTVEDFVNSSPSAEFFTAAVSEEDAPGYSCAVPIGMCLSKIQNRLRPGKASSNHCYYRGVEGVLADVNTIVDNCLLYNSPESALVEAASELVSELKKEISHVAQRHYREMKDAQNADEERRRLVMHGGSSDGMSEAQTKALVVDTLTKPFKEPVYRDWLQLMCLEAAPEAHDEIAPWVPQAGDDVLYSRRSHRRFVKGHYRSLRPDQCLIPRFGNDPASTAVEETEPEEEERGSANEDDEALMPDWMRGTVVWTRSAFPKAPSKKSDEDAVTFPTSSVLLALGIRFQHAKSEQQSFAVVYWRPCVFRFESVFNESGCCSSCGLSHKTSFLRPTSVSLPDDKCQGRAVSAGEGVSLTDGEVGDVDRCFALLKRRCIRRVPPGHVDHQLTKENVKGGYLSSSTKIGIKSLPFFENDFKIDQEPAQDSVPSIGTRGVKPKGSGGDSSIPSIPPLVEAGFLPPWFSTLRTQELLNRYETILPCPKLSLELVHLRLKNGFYRHKVAIENDLVEAYVSTVLQHLSEAASRKKDPVSARRVAKSLSSDKGKAKEPQDESTVEASLSSRVNGTSKAVAVSHVSDRVVEEETAWVTRIRRIRELFATALFSVSETINAELIFGLVDPPTAKPKAPLVESESPQQDPVRAQARQKLRVLLLAVGRDECLNTFATKHGNDPLFSYPPLRVKVLCDGRRVEHDKFISTHTQAIAQTEDGDVPIRISCGGNPVTFERTVAPLSRAIAILEKKPIKVKITAGGYEVLGEPRGRTPVARITMDAVAIQPDEYEGNDDFAKLFFARPKRMQSCARCQVYKRSMLGCRVRRAHSNIDFDWIEHFRGLGGIDGLLRILKGAEEGHENAPEASGAPVAVSLQDGVVNKGTANGDEDAATDAATDAAKACSHTDGDEAGDPENRKRSASAEAAHQIGLPPTDLTEAKDDIVSSERESASMAAETGANKSVASIDGDISGATRETDLAKSSGRTHGDVADDPDGGSKDETPDPRELVDKAKAALSLAKEVLVEARVYANAPTRLSEEFIRSCVPVDPTDGHYVYCIICGMGGNLLCCDGCANVVHSHCVSLPTIPDEDWFCEECVAKNSMRTAAAPFSRDAGMIQAQPDKNGPVEDESVQTGSKATTKSSTEEVTTKQQAESTAAATAADRSQDETDATSRNEDEEKAKSQDASEAVHSADDNLSKNQQTNTVCHKSDGARSPAETKRLPFGRVLFHQEKADDVASLLDQIRSFRPESTRQQKTTRDLDAGESSSDDDDGGGDTKKRRSRSRKRGEEDRAVLREDEQAPRKARDRSPKVIYKTDSESESYVPRNRRSHSPKVIYKTDSESESYVPRRRRRKSKSAGKKRSKPSNPFDALSSTSQRFLDSIGITTAEQFLSSVTGDVAAKFVRWRRKEGMPKLRGSGATASVAGWKTKVKDASNESEREESDDVKPAPSRKKSKGASRRRKTKSNGRGSGASRRERPKPELTDPLDALSSLGQSFLDSIGVITAEQFLTSRTSDIADQLVKWRRKEGLPKLQGTGASATVSSWKTLVRNAAITLGLDVPDVEPAQSKAKGSAQKRKGSTKNREIPPIHRRKKRKTEFADPLEALSSPALRFLGSIGIDTGENFLSSSTSEIAEKLVAWRRKEGMPKLKGDGAAATLAGWKTKVRTVSKDDQDEAPNEASIPVVRRRSGRQQRTPGDEDSDRDDGDSPRRLTQAPKRFIDEVYEALQEDDDESRERTSPPSRETQPGSRKKRRNSRSNGPVRTGSMVDSVSVASENSTPKRQHRARRSTSDGTNEVPREISHPVHRARRDPVPDTEDSNDESEVEEKKEAASPQRRRARPPKRFVDEIQNRSTTGRRSRGRRSVLEKTVG